MAFTSASEGRRVKRMGLQTTLGGIFRPSGADILRRSQERRDGAAAVDNARDDLDARTLDTISHPALRAGLGLD
jgi:hypothetical protein